MPDSGTRTGICLECGARVPIITHTIESPSGKHHDLGHLAAHHRPGTRAGTRCRGSFGAWTDPRTT